MKPKYDIKKSGGGRGLELQGNGLVVICCFYQWEGRGISFRLIPSPMRPRLLSFFALSLFSCFLSLHFLKVRNCRGLIGEV